MDYVGVKRYGADGKALGEVRFVGLFTAEAYDEPARDVPLIRRKVGQRAGPRRRRRPAATTKSACATSSRPTRATSCSRSTRTSCCASALGILHLYDRPRVRLFARRDPFDRFVSVLLFVPRERYDSDVARAGRRDPGRGLGRAGVGLLSQLLRRAAGARPLHHRRHPGRPRRARPAPRSRPRSPRPRAPGTTASRPPCATAAAAGRGRRPLARYARRLPAPATATTTTPPRRWPTWR